MSYNSDYSSTNPGGFLQHTYQPQQQNDLYYYSGGMVNPYASIVPQNDSRRNVFNPVNPFAQFGQTQTQFVPESAVQPFASYPPATPSGAQPMGLNAMIESRRNVPSAPVASPQANPWASQQQVPQTPNPQTLAVFNSFPGTSNTWFDGGLTPGYRIDMSTMALYGDTQMGFDKHQSWENYYTQNRPIPMPSINWGAQANQAQACYNQPMMPQYPVQQYPSAQANWKEIAERNWGSSKL